MKNRNLDRRRIKQLQDESDGLGRAQKVAEEINKSGSRILADLKTQSDMMKGVYRKTQDMLKQLGVSDSILTRIERRSKEDLLIFFGLCIFTLAFIFFLNSYVKPWLFSGFTAAEELEE